MNQRSWIDGKAHRWFAVRGGDLRGIYPSKKHETLSPCFPSFPFSIPPRIKGGWLLPHAALQLGHICPQAQAPPCLFCLQGMHLGGSTSRPTSLQGQCPNWRAASPHPPIPVNPVPWPRMGFPPLGAGGTHFLSTSAWQKTFRLDRWLSSLPTGTRLLWL